MTEVVGLAMKVSALVSVGLLAATALRRQPAALRHWVLAVTVACALAMPLVSWIAPQWPGPLPWPAPAPPARVEPAAGSAANDTRLVVAGDGRPARPVVPPRVAPRGSMGSATLVWTVWLGGALVSGLVLVVGLARLRWMAAHARAAGDPRWRQIAEPLRRRYGLRRPVRVLQSDHPALLVTWGWRTPTILLPAHATQWTAERIRVVLAHELAHLARGDWTAQLGAEALRALNWFNPLVWAACRRLRTESECACDDVVLAQGIDAPDYATHLLALARLQSRRHPSLPAPAMARPSSLEGRVRAMLNHTLNRRAVSSRARAVSAAALLGLTVVVAGLQAQPQLAQVSGTAFDPSGRVLPNVRLVLTNTRDQSKFEVRTDGDGRYTFAGVPAAEYTMEASVPGFATVKDVVRIDGPIERDLRLRVGTLQETITVDAASEPSPAQDAASAERRDEARRRAQTRAELARARCAGGPPNGAVGGNILAPTKLVHVSPTMPAHLRATTTRGHVTMTAVIGTDGLVRDVQNVQGPHPDLEAAAVEAVRQWQFSTTFLNCEPIEVQMHVTTNFVSR